MAARGEVERPSRSDPELDLLRRLGERHEKEHRALLSEHGRKIAVIDYDRSTIAGLEKAEADTTNAMRAGADAVYQAALFETRTPGHSGAPALAWRDHA